MKCHYCNRNAKWTVIQMRGENLRTCNQHLPADGNIFPIAKNKLIKSEKSRYKLVNGKWERYYDPILTTYDSDMVL